MSSKTGADFDLVVVGSGPGGQRAAVQAAKLGKRALVIERAGLGGSCLDRGTIPSKTLREAVLDPRKSHPIALAEVFRHMHGVIEAERNVIREQLRRNHVEVVAGQASFEDANTLRVESPAGAPARFRAERVVIATGTRPCRPAQISFDNNKNVFDSDTIFTIEQKPRRLLVMGAGVIGCEYASIFARADISVVLWDRREELLRSIDPEIVSALRTQLASDGIELRLGTAWPEIESFDAVLVCMGRQGNTETLALDRAGLSHNERGLIEVNEHYQSAVPHIYAVGDVIGAPALASSSSEQGRLAAAHAFGVEAGRFPSSFPYGIYTIPEISSAGLSEEALKARGEAYVVGRARYSELARGRILGDENGFLKLIFDAHTRALRGVHVIGTGATELVHIGQVAMALGGTVDFFVEHVFNYPTLAEAYKVAAYNAFNQFQSRPSASR
jgi:NAD(P) transhydrogenase